MLQARMRPARLLIEASSVFGYFSCLSSYLPALCGRYALSIHSRRNLCRAGLFDDSRAPTSRDGARLVLSQGADWLPSPPLPWFRTDRLSLSRG